jgi:superfamily I DNA/RNA helicase
MLTPTGEQQAAVDAFATGATVVIEAGAGTGKTSTLRLLAAARPQAKGL